LERLGINAASWQRLPPNDEWSIVNCHFAGYARIGVSMELWLVAIPVEGGEDARRLFALLRELRVPMDPCAGDPRVETDSAGKRRLMIVVTASAQEQLRAAGRPFEVVRDFADLPDPRSYVSRKNRFAEELARLRASKTER
jgi:hypothetical protein